MIARMTPRFWFLLGMLAGALIVLLVVETTALVQRLNLLESHLNQLANYVWGGVHQ